MCLCFKYVTLLSCSSLYTFFKLFVWFLVLSTISHQLYAAFETIKYISTQGRCPTFRCTLYNSTLLGYVWHEIPCVSVSHEMPCESVSHEIPCESVSHEMSHERVSHEMPPYRKISTSMTIHCHFLVIQKFLLHLITCYMLAHMANLIYYGKCYMHKSTSLLCAKLYL